MAAGNACCWLRHECGRFRVTHSMLPLIGDWPFLDHNLADLVCFSCYFSYQISITQISMISIHKLVSQLSKERKTHFNFSVSLWRWSGHWNLSYWYLISKTAWPLDWNSQIVVIKRPITNQWKHTMTLCYPISATLHAGVNNRRYLLPSTGVPQTSSSFLYVNSNFAAAQ